MMPSTSKDAEKEEFVEVPPEIPNLEVNPEEMEEIVVVSDDQIQEEIIVDGEEIIYADDDEVEEYGIEYDAVVSISNQKNMFFDFQMYQPHATPHGTFVCKICMRAGKDTEYPDRAAFVAHRYKCHGSFNNNVICPLQDCREVYASLYSLRRHLGQEHELPLEVHLQTFTNIGEFEKFRHLVEMTTGCKYMMHTKQPKFRRQVMHCAKSEHKLVLQTQKHRLPRERMLKEGSACPSVISYRVNAANGEVHAFMQLFHVGHAPDAESYGTNADSARPLDVVFPVKPPCWAGHPMQYVQIDVHEMSPAVYGTKIYESILIVTCLKTKFMWARPLFESTRTAIGRILNSIFNEYGVPEGFSTSYHPTYIRDTMKSLESVYAVEIREIWNEPPPYIHLERWVLELAEHELGTRNRWVEQLQFVVMEYNQKHIPVKDGTPFERMFNRKAPNLYHNGDEQDLIAAKCKKYNTELRREAQGMDDNLSAVFEISQKVFLRKGITKPRRGNNTQFYFGYISDHDPNNPYYPFKVHYSSTDSPWPSERNQYVWVSVFDLLPTIHGISEMTTQEKQSSIATYMCCCSGEESSKFDLSAIGKQARLASKCLLFRNLLCTNSMSKFCCKTVGPRPCRFHQLYPENDESYSKMDAVLIAFLQGKDMAKVEEEEKDQTGDPIRRMIAAELERTRIVREEAERVEYDNMSPPPNLEPIEERIDVESLDELEPAVPLGERDFDFEKKEEEPITPQSPKKLNGKSLQLLKKTNEPRSHQKSSHLHHHPQILWLQPEEHQHGKRFVRRTWKTMLNNLNLNCTLHILHKF
uniref:C2H2-type domain-containing protein n=1 Tax=Caenorhabditis tropicalis TaxID=1561998 RepID=A0A1I7UJW3_9PELO